MKIEILFRGKSVDKNEFVYGLPYSSCYDEELDQIVVHDYHVDIRPETIGQFTGLTDKNGVKIFEGDITNFGEVLFYFGCFCIKSEDSGNEVNLIDWNIHKIEIIGNIHDA